MSFVKFMKHCLHTSGQLVKYGVVIYCTSHCISEYIADFTWCTGPSMQPTIQSDDVVLTEHISTRFLHKIKRGDIVILKSPSDPKTFLCKRVVGTEFDKIPSTSWKFLYSSQVPKGHLWVEGDNTSNSSDSRSFGPVPFALLRGRAVCKVWPIARIGPLAAAPNR